MRKNSARRKTPKSIKDSGFVQSWNLGDNVKSAKVDRGGSCRKEIAFNTRRRK